LSRGLGKRQRQIIIALSKALDEGNERGLLPRQIRQIIGSDDRPNTRKSIRGLEERDLVERDGELVKLTFWGALSAGGMNWQAGKDSMLEEQRNRDRELEEFVRAVREAREEEIRRYQEEEERWEKPAPRYERLRRPSKNQRRVAAVIVRYAADPQRGLPAPAVRKIAGIADAGNTTRAIRTLTERAILQRSKDGKRLRMALWYSPLLWARVPASMDPPLDDAEARAVLEGFGEWAGVVE
jgi:hypothetical protein